MAQIAGMELESHWAGWDHREFTAESTSHVSLWTPLAEVDGPPRAVLKHLVHRSFGRLRATLRVSLRVVDVAL